MVYIGAAVARQNETYNTLVKLIPALGFHTGFALAGALCFGVAQRMTNKGRGPVAQRC